MRQISDGRRHRQLYWQRQRHQWNQQLTNTNTQTTTTMPHGSRIVSTSSIRPIVRIIPHPSDVLVRIVDVARPCERQGWLQIERRASVVRSPLTLGRCRRLRVRRSCAHHDMGQPLRRTMCGGLYGKTSGEGTCQPSGKGMCPRLGKSGMRHQTVYVYPAVPGDDTAGTHQ